MLFRSTVPTAVPSASTAGILKSANMDFNSVLMATCIGAAVGCFLTAILANVPFCQAPGWA